MSFLDMFKETPEDRCNRLIKDYTKRYNSAMTRAAVYRDNLQYDYAEKQEELAESMENMIREVEKVKANL